MGVDKLPKQWVGEALVGNISDWENSTTNWRLVGEAMAEETKARSQGDKPSEKLRHAVIYWAGESHIHHIESFLNALDQLGAPVLGRKNVWRASVHSCELLALLYSYLGLSRGKRYLMALVYS